MLILKKKSYFREMDAPRCKVKDRNISKDVRFILLFLRAIKSKTGMFLKRVIYSSFPEGYKVKDRNILKDVRFVLLFLGL